MSSTQTTTQYDEDTTPNLLSELLERNPDEFLELVSQHTENPAIKLAVINWLNDTSIYNTWYSYGWAQLIYLVGDLVSQEEEDEEDEEEEDEESFDYRDYFYGGNSAISDEQGCEIFNLLIEINGSSPNVNVTNIYNENINEIVLREGTIHDRTNNEQFNALVLRTTGYQVDEQ